MVSFRFVVVLFAAASVSLLPFSATGQPSAGLPSPTFHLPFDGNVQPAAAAGAAKHPSLKPAGAQFVEGKSGKAVLLGNGPVLVYQAGGNVPNEATLSFWLKPMDWEKLREWRKLVTICPGGRSGMMFAHYPGRAPHLQFRWGASYGGAGHEATKRPLTMNKWNHVAIAWDSVRSRIYFNGDLALSRQHDGDFRPNLGPKATLHFGGIIVGTSSGKSYGRNPWGKADTALDEFVVYPGMLNASQIAQLAGTDIVSTPVQGPPREPQLLAVPKLLTPPDLDGQLAEGEWAGATSLPVLIDAREPGKSFDYPKQEFHLAYDEANLYVAARVHFPLGADIPKGGLRKGRDAPDNTIFGDESFEFWLFRSDTEKRYRFAGNVAGGFNEILGKDMTWNGEWTYSTSTRTTIYGNETWDIEVAVPFDTIGIADPDGVELKMNLCRTWRCLEKLGLTTWCGQGNYPLVKHYGKIVLSPDAVGVRLTGDGSPSAGEFGQVIDIANPGGAPFAGVFELVLQAANADDDQVVRSFPLQLDPGASTTMSAQCAITDPMFQRVAYVLRREGKTEPSMRYSVPFELRTDFLDVVPLNLQHRLVVKPAYALFRAYAARDGAETARVELRVTDSEGNRVATRVLTEDTEISFELPETGPWGEYSVEMLAFGEDGDELGRNDGVFQRPQTPVWATQRDDSMDRVLPPFTPLKTQVGENGDVQVSCWGRTYTFGGSMFPTALKNGDVPDVLVAPIQLHIGGEPAGGLTPTVVRESAVRDEFTATVGTDTYSLKASLWIEYDGLIWYDVELEAKAALAGATLAAALRPDQARYTHYTASMMSLGGGHTAVVDGPLALKFWPVVWVGNYERGLCWFTEGLNDLATSAKHPINIVPEGDSVRLEVRLVDALAAGEKATMRFGLLATPVKPQNPRYPLNFFAQSSALYKQPPTVPLYSTVWWTFHKWFLDLPEYSKSLGKWGTPADWAPSKTDTVTRWTPYLDPCTLTPEYPEARHYLREWEILPAQHRQGFKRKLPDGGEEPFAELWLSPASESFRKYYAWRVADLIRRTGIRGLYFDFGCAMRDSNKYHGANGGYYILGLRDFYRRMVNEFVKAGIDDPVIVVHNSMSVQIPTLTFATHLFNGEHHRTKSGTTLHHGKDYLDTLPLHYFGIEHSGLPWGLHGNMLPEFPEAKQLVEGLGVTDETVTEYLWNRTGSVIMPILLHGCLPGGVRVSHPYYKRVLAILTQFDIPSAVFHPYWRNVDAVTADNLSVKVSLYARPDAPKLLLVVGNLADEGREITIKLSMDRFYNGWSTSPLVGMKRVAKKGEIMHAVERMGTKNARLLEVGPHHVKLWVRGHDMALVEVDGHEKVR
ncbi:MAG: hypothetical protein HN742_11295 [Lentisphaerae bacterium]|jgi:hypothetical protein|nr:hypothetical protein [Lentisphaerota bacterium]MBT4816071.1 hypothetical protein [Lentisphaerota bacterium]MBT5609053.1 hypothetical protein [Lentisphaerota bacterium]MBT7059962.1 hypothetical protein [Lentisphaerota bacterium]MBT7842451.1 hypothetical protein [Lentisphaerota bacterium]